MEKIKVEVRIKPNKSNVLEFTENRITVGSKTFTFSRVHSNITQIELYNSSVSPLISRFADGENCSVLAYGQTGSGKTYTIGIASHTEEKNDNTKVPEKAIIQYSLEAMFELNLELSCTYIEIYNEAIIDLLGDSRSSLPLRQGMGEITIVGLKEVEVKTLEDALMLLNLGTERRTTKSTKMNTESSRSHAIFTVILRKNVGNKIIESKMAFVDLAGSERLKRTECTGNRAKESISINTGLLSLGNVISALYHKQAHIPFRDSKLTRILETCLIGHVFLIACVSGQQEDMFETTNTLKYASRAALITLNTKVKIENDKDKLVVMRLKKEISKLKDEVQRLRGMMLKQENIRSHPFVMDLMNRLRKYEEEHEIMHQSITDSNSTEKSYSINRNSVHRKLAGLELEKLDLSQSDSETSMDSDKTIFYPSEGIERSSIIAENTLSNRIISPIKEEEASRDSKKRKRIVTFESSKKCIVSPPPKVYFKQADTIFDASAVSMVIHNEQLFFNSTDSKIRHYDPVASKISIVVSDDGIRSLRSYKDLYYYTKSLLKIHTGQGKPLPVYAYRNEITSLEMKNSLVFSGHEDGTLCILDRRSNELVFSKKIHKGPIFDIKVVNDGFYCAGRDCKISFGEMRDFESIRTVMPSHSDVVSALLSFKGKCISLSRDCSIKAWDRDRMVDSIPSAHKSWIRCGSTFNNFFITGCKGGSLRCWNFADDSLECIGKVDISMGINCILNYGNDLWVGCQNSNIYRYSLNID